MVVSKDGKRKRKESPVVDSSPEIPKRTKVQAQRKFAQGQGNPSASYSLSNVIAASSSQPNTPIRENKEPIPELIPHKKPSAEDLVTYICFRGTPGLPPHLDFFNQNNKSADKDDKKDSKSDEAATNDVSNNSKPGSKKGNKSTAEKAEKSEKNGTVEKKNDKKAAETVEKPETIGYAARKRADQVVEGNRKFKNTERLTRLRDRTPKKAETNRRSPRTRSAYKAESEEDEVEENEEDDGEDENDASVVSESKKTPVKKTPVRGRRKTTTPAAKEDEPSVAEKPTESDLDTSTPVSNLRNKRGAKVPPTPERKIIQNEKKATPTPEKISAPTPEKNDKRADSVSKKSDISSKISSKGGKNTPVKRNLKEKAKPQPQSENEEENAEITPPKPKRGRKSAVPDTSKKSQVESSLRSDNNTPECENRSARPMRKTKEAATIYMEWIGLKLNLDDDGSSLDSFPELPNAKETQKIENELKQNSLKAKSQPKPTPTKKKGGKAKGATQPKKNKKETTPKVEEPEIQETKVEVQRSEEVNDKQPSKKSKVDECVVEKDGRYFSDSDDEPLIAQKIEVETKPPPNNKKGKPIKKKGMGTPKAAAKKKNVTSQKKEESAPDEPPKGAKSVIEDVKECLVESQPEVVKDSKLEKSFSDSDDEPLATKLVTKQPEKELKSEPEPLQIITEITPITLPKISPPKDEKLASPIKLAPTQNTLTRLEERSFMKGPTSPKYPVNKPPQPVTLSVHRSEPVTPPGQVIQSIPVMTPPGPFSPLMERFPSPKVNPSFLTPKFDRNLDRKLSMEPITSPKNNLPSPSISRLDFSSSKPASPSGSPANTKKIEPDLISAANLMPSKEESSKIFGIASVSLAQSSGPDNTKCTLGKCGSIHKPVLGPVVPTEAYLGEPLSSKERRKAKVNMTHEQIQRWLIECSSNPDDIQDDLDDDFDEPLKPKTFAPTPPLIREEKDSGSLSSKTGKEVRSESTWSGKGPSLKATPVVVKEDSRERPSSVLATDMSKHDSSFENRASPKPQKIFGAVTKEKTSSPTTTLKKSESISKTTPDNVKSPKPSTSSATSSPKHLKNVKAAPNVSQKKLPMPKRQPVYSTKPVPSDVNKKKVSTNSFSAFSPENETSVYSFDKEDYVPPPVAKPFRRHSRRESNADENTSSEKQTKPEKGSAKEAQQNSISVMLSPEENTKSIKVSLENTDAVAAIAKAEKPNADSSAVGDSDSEGHTFYIPLQGTGATAANAGKTDVIQGVAVKLGREGPEGPNQRVIMHATLVTKAQMGSNTTPIPDSMNVHEIVKNLLSSSKDSSVAATTSKSVPVGTVQPRFKSNAAEPSQNASGSGLTRVNSNSSLLSGSTKSKPAPPAPKKPKDTTPVKMSNNTAFPRRDDPTQMVEAPIFRPTDKEFQDPMEFIERITPIAARFGICKIIPPDSFKPECRVSDDMRFTAYNQYVHKMLHRWGPSAKEFSAIKKYLATQSIAMTHPPWIGGMEVDLPRLYHTVQELGGLKEVIEKKKWARVAEEMCIPKLAQDRVTKLDDIYCKYLLPYDTLSPAERQKLFDEVEADWAKREARARRNADRCVNLENISNEDGESSENDDESDEEVDGVSMECIVKGRSMPLNAFFRIARNTMALWFKNTEPTVADIEAEFWRHVAVRDSHVCVHSGSIDSSGWGYGFPTPGPKTKGSTCARHPWNLKVLTNNAGSVLRSLGPVMGITVPTLHVGMLFSACCWYRDPHGLSWIEYLHTGASKIWYGIPDEQSSKFRKALTSLIPTHCQNKTIWLPCDTAMVPPHMLTDRGVSLCRVEQKPGEYVVVFPRAYTSSIATGYVVSESVYFATSSWLDSAKDDFRDIHESCEPAMFSLEQVLFAISNDQRVSADSITQILPMLSEVYDKEVAARQQLKAAGLTQTERFQQPVAKTKQKMQVVEEHECDLCRANLYISMVRTTEGNIYCLQHALRNINNGNIQAKQCTLIFTFDIEDIESLIKKTKDRLSQSHKKGGGNGSTSKKSK